jgi:hypothetical protein
MPEIPSYLDLERHRDLAGRSKEPWVRRALLTLVLAFVVAALLNTFGQRSSSAGAANPAASLKLTSPERLRGGLLFQARVEVRPRRDLSKPTLVFNRDWFDGMTLNTTIPQGLDQLNHDGQVVITYDSLKANESLVIWLEFQVNPTALGTRHPDIELYDGSTHLLGLRRSVTVFP